MIADLAAGLFLVTIIYILARPRSGGVQLIQAVSGALAAIVTQAADLAAPTESTDTQDGN